jgi:hypothetical protein
MESVEAGARCPLAPRQRASFEDALPNSRMDLPGTAAQPVLRSRCVLLVPAAHARVRRTGTVPGTAACHRLTDKSGLPHDSHN